MYAVRVVGMGWLKGVGRGWLYVVDLKSADHYATREEAESTVLRDACSRPNLIGRFRIRKIRSVEWRRSPTDVRTMWVTA